MAMFHQMDFRSYLDRSSTNAAIKSAALRGSLCKRVRCGNGGENRVSL